MLLDIGYRQPENSAGMQRELGKILGDHGHHPGVVGTWRHFRENHIIPFDEKLHSKDATPTEAVGHRFSVSLGLGFRCFAHGLRLPTFTVVSVHLDVPDRFTEGGAAHVAHGQLGDFVIKIHKTLDNHLAFAGTPTLLSVLPGRLNFVFASHRALAFARRTHDRLDHEWQTDRLNRLFVFFFIGGEPVRGGFQTELFRSKTANSFAIHGQLGCSRCRNDRRHTLLLQCSQCIGRDRFNFRHYEVRPLLLNDSTQGNSIEHRDHMRPVRHLHRRSIFVGINSDYLDTVTLEFNDDFFAEFARPTEHDSGGFGSERGSYACHGVHLRDKFTFPKEKSASSALQCQLSRNGFSSSGFITQSFFEKPVSWLVIRAS